MNDFDPLGRQGDASWDPRPVAPSDKPGHFSEGGPGIPSDIPGQSLADVHTTFLKWLGKDYDLDALDAILATGAVEQLGGDPCWLLVVSGSGAAKTESVMPLSGVGAHIVSTITGEAALISGTAEKEKAKDAHGGLLRKIGERGILVIKDVTSILSMQRDSRAAVLAALREIYDGRWDREIGQDGGKTLTWKGRLVVIGAVTTAWDAAHAVISTMGDRFVLVRMDSATKQNRRSAGLQALRNVNQETTMRDELADAVAGLLAGIDASADYDLNDEEMLAIFDLADIVTLSRTAVERDYQGNVLEAHAPEMPTRFAKQLAQIMRGAVAIGRPRDAALDLAARCAGDSMPPLRLRVLLDVAVNPLSGTAAVVKRTQLPRKTTDRILQELQLLKLLSMTDVPYGDNKVRWLYSLSDQVDRGALEKLARNVGGTAKDPKPESGQECQGEPQARPQTPCAKCDRMQWNAEGSPLCGACRSAT
ncbi:hypothetical protein [Streptomyces chartreusis]|uniref:hypothetical protein n=1 Tax=Streptomyces chartreusis TaxID=1969 RepID=UPI0033DD4EF6